MLEVLSSFSSLFSIHFWTFFIVILDELFFWSYQTMKLKSRCETRCHAQLKFIHTEIFWYRFSHQKHEISLTFNECTLDLTNRSHLHQMFTLEWIPVPEVPLVTASYSSLILTHFLLENLFFRFFLSGQEACKILYSHTAFSV